MSHLSLEELELLEDPKYRNYISAIDKALKNFEYTSEWADLIAALGKLNKVLQAHSKYNVIPRRVIIAKRLAQCLHPALPSGVHLKALETYDLIFRLVGSGRLSNELFIYSAGLYPLLAHAAINVRPILLNLYETHLVPIAEYLKPGLSGFLNGVLPGLEEHADHYDKTNALLDKVCQGVSPVIFYGCLWKCVIDNSHIRLPAYTYILSHLNRKMSLDDQLHILGHNIDLMVQSLCASLEDNSVLVQRNVLEFLLAAFPIHGAHLVHSDVVQILAAAFVTLLRRDMSLNRRLFSWLFGGEVQAQLANFGSQTNKLSEPLISEAAVNNTVFQKYSKQLVIEALQRILKHSSTFQPIDLRPYRILISLLEKPEIGPVILDDILLDVFRALYLSSRRDQQHEELVKTANLLFGTLEQCYVWSYAGRLVKSSCCNQISKKEVQDVGSGTANFLEMCNLVSFLLELLSTDFSSETQTEHLPSLLLQTVELLEEFCPIQQGELVTAGLEMCLCILKRVQPCHATEEWIRSRARKDKEDSEVNSEEFHSPPSSPALFSSSQQQQQLLEQSMSAVQKLLAKLINPGILPVDLLERAEDVLRIEQGDAAQPTLDDLLEECIESNGISVLPKPVVKAADKEHFEYWKVFELEAADEECLLQLEPVLKKCCQLLKELSSFPTYCSATNAVQPAVSEMNDWSSLPKWLRLLCVSCTLLTKKIFPSSLTAASTLLDFTALTLSTMPSSFWKNQLVPNKSTTSTDVYTVVLLPAISPSHLLILLKKSRVYQVLATRLWEEVNDHRSQQLCAELLHQLHTLSLPLLENVAEDAILASLDNDVQQKEKSTNTLKRFSLLWHLGRDLEPSRCGSRRLRTFDRCLMLLLDWLSLSPACPQRSAAESWLIQALLRNDFSRIVDPLLMKLLLPCSARVSIRHVTVQSSIGDGDAQLHDEDNIYAISSVNGHVIYHVSPTKSKAYSLPANRSVLALGWQGKAAECYVARELPFPWQLPQQPATEECVGLFVNPFPEDLFLEQTSNVDQNSTAIVTAILDEMLDTIISKSAAAAAASRTISNVITTSKPEKRTNIHPLHNHLLLYCQVSDAQQTLHVLQTLRNLLLCQPRLVLLSLASSNIASSRSPHATNIQEFLARHRKCLFGNGFHGEIFGDWLAPYRSSMYLEILLQVLLYHARSFYSNLGVSSLTREEIMANRQVQLCCIQLLSLLLNELLPLVRDSGKGFSSYVSDLLNRCRVQKVALHSTLAMLHTITMNKDKSKRSKSKQQPYQQLTLTEEIVLFNEEQLQDGSSYSEASLVYLLQLLLSIIALEDHLSKQTGTTQSETNGPSSSSSTSAFQRGVPLHSQPLFMTAVVTALKQKSNRWLHTEFSRLLAASLPFLGRSLPSILNAVVPQLCLNLESLVTLTVQNVPPDYLVTELEALTALCHYVLLDINTVAAPALAGSAGLLSGLSWGGTGSNGNSASTFANGQILHNLLHAFTPTAAATVFNVDAAGNDPYATARRNMLSNFPRIISCIASLWKISYEGSYNSATKQRQKLLDFVSPIAHHHGSSFLAAIGVAWLDKKDLGINTELERNKDKSKLLPIFSAEQLTLVDLVVSIRVLPPDNLVQLLRQVLKQPPQVQLQNRNSRLEVALMHFFHAYLHKISRDQLGECWISLLQLLREVVTMSSPILFAALTVFGEAVQRCPTLGDKRNQRELQEVTSKLLEACSTVAAACLEQTTWLRRNLSVRRDLAAALPAGENQETTTSCESSSSISGSTTDGSNPESSGTLAAVNSSSTAQYSIQALKVLAELLAPLQDLIFPSEDKERVIPLLTSLLANVVPYLKHHSQSNIHGLRAASQLLSSLSTFPATRRAWRRDVFELLLDPSFFMVDIQTLRHWKNIIDNLMCHDKDAFRELLNRVSVTPGTSLGIFSSREQEIEQRAILLKRLAYSLFCTEGDQYQRYLPDIQEKLSESLRLAQTWPAVQAQVFLCFRVLLLRTSQQHVTSLWPSVVTETVQVLAQLEHELRRESEEFSTQLRRLSTLDSTWLTNANNGLQGHAHPAWLHLYLATCKLLHLAIVLPATRLPQFQMYRWAFVGDEAANDGDIGVNHNVFQQLTAPNFVPYLTRIYRLLRRKAEMNGIPLQPVAIETIQLPSAYAMKSIMDLFPFFHALEQHGIRSSVADDHIISLMEHTLEKDFLEPIPL